MNITVISDDFVNPVVLKVNDLKTKGKNDIEIINILEKQGMWWDPKTGAAAIGEKPTLEELKYLPQDTVVTEDDTYYQINQVMDVVLDQYHGSHCMMKPGTLSVGDHQTAVHIITTHVGYTGNNGKWCEAGITKYVWDPRYLSFTYDNDEGGYLFHNNVTTTGAETYNTYNIKVSPNRDSYGYQYNIWIDNRWVRSGHVDTYNCNVDHANEAFSFINDRVFTLDFSRARFMNDMLWYSDQQLIYWNTNILTGWWSSPILSCPMYQTHYISQNSWVYETWMERST